MILQTVGYEGRSIEAFFDELVANRVETLVDIRELPISHKAGFSKTALGKRANESHLQYVHLPALGCPKEIRHEYREDKDWAKYSRRFLTYLRAQETALQELAERVQRERCCLLCFEGNHLFCHRRYVAWELQIMLGADLEVKHLAPIEKEAVAWLPSLAGIPIQQ